MRQETKIKRSKNTNSRLFHFEVAIEVFINMQNQDQSLVYGELIENVLDLFTNFTQLNLMHLRE